MLKVQEQLQQQQHKTTEKRKPQQTEQQQTTRNVYGGRVPKQKWHSLFVFQYQFSVSVDVTSPVTSGQDRLQKLMLQDIVMLSNNKG